MIRAASTVAGAEPRPYTLLRLRGALDAGTPGQFFMLEAPGRLLPRPMSLALATPGELAFLVDPIGPGTRALCALDRGDSLHVLGPLGNGFRLDVERPLLVGGGIGVAPFPFLSEALGRPPALLGFRTALHAEAAALVPNAEVVLEPTYVTEPLEQLVAQGHDVLACGPEPMLVAVRRARSRRAARLGSAHGLRIRRLLRLRGRDRRLLEAPVRRRPRPSTRGGGCDTEPRAQRGGGVSIALLNASGCLDALTAPDVARSLDAFVTKTVTPLPRAGNPPVRIAEVEGGMLNSIGLANPGIDAFLDDHLPRLASLGLPLWVSVGGFAAAEYAETCARLDEREAVTSIELNLSCPNVEEAPETAAEIVLACRERPRKPLYAKLSPATWDVGESARAVEAAGADGLSLINTIRGLALDQRTLHRGSRDAPAALGARAEADRARLRRRLPPGHESADRRHGRRPDGPRRARPARGRRRRRRARHRPLRRPRRARSSASRARRERRRLCGLCRSERGRRSSPGTCGHVARKALDKPLQLCGFDPPWHRVRLPPPWFRPRPRRRHPHGRSTREWKPSSGPMTSGSAVPS